MLYLSGVVRPEVAQWGGGYMLTPWMGNVVDLTATPWAADTGCFRWPERFDLSHYLQWLQERPQATCLWATAPDVVGDAAETLRRALPILPRLRAIGYRTALVAQDGLESLPVPWDSFDALFIGGTTAWKLSEVAWGLVAEAKRRGKWAHVGRVNSWRRIRAAQVAGADSVDGTYLQFGPDTNLPKLRRWIHQMAAQPPLGSV